MAAEVQSFQVLERAKGIEPSYAAWEAAVLPLNYARGDAFIPWRPEQIHIEKLGPLIGQRSLRQAAYLIELSSHAFRRVSLRSRDRGVTRSPSGRRCQRRQFGHGRLSRLRRVPCFRFLAIPPANMNGYSNTCP
jgi:hypothetical protein